jgi:hypothetical protein
MITNPAIDVLQRELEETDRQISEMAEALKASKAKHKSLADALAVLTGQPALSHASRSTVDSSPTLKEQILDLLAPDGMGLAPAEIAHLLTENGRETGNTTVSSTLSRMKKEGVVVKRGGKWFLPQTDASQDVRELPPAAQGIQSTQPPDWVNKVAQDLSYPHQNPASAEAGEANTQRGHDPLGILGLKPVPRGTQD